MHGKQTDVLPIDTIEEILLWDSARQKNLPLRVVYPKRHNTGESRPASPVIIFSHGAGGDKDGYSTWTHFWASHGYVCLSPTHADALVLRPHTSRKDELAKIVQAVDTDFDGWANRALDLSFLIDSLSQVAEMLPNFGGRIDGKTIGVCGHSYGAHTSMLIAGASLYDDKQFRDERVSACLVMSPQGPGRSGLNQASFPQIATPTFFMTGSRDLGPHNEDPRWRCQAYELAQPPDKFQAFFHGATHLSFARRQVLGSSAQTIRPADWPFAIAKADLKDGKVSQQTIAKWVKKTSLAFFDAYLKQDAQAKRLLQSAEFAEQTDGLIEWSFK